MRPGPPSRPATGWTRSRSSAAAPPSWWRSGRAPVTPSSHAAERHPGTDFLAVEVYRPGRGPDAVAPRRCRRDERAAGARADAVDVAAPPALARASRCRGLDVLPRPVAEDKAPQAAAGDRRPPPRWCASRLAPAGSGAWPPTGPTTPRRCWQAGAACPTAVQPVRRPRAALRGPSGDQVRAQGRGGGAADSRPDLRARRLTGRCPGRGGRGWAHARSSRSTASTACCPGTQRWRHRESNSDPPPGRSGWGGWGWPVTARWTVRDDGGPLQAVYAYASGDLDWWSGELGRELRTATSVRTSRQRGSTSAAPPRVSAGGWGKRATPSRRPAGDRLTHPVLDVPVAHGRATLGPALRRAPRRRPRRPTARVRTRRRPRGARAPARATAAVGAATAIATAATVPGGRPRRAGGPAGPGPERGVVPGRAGRRDRLPQPARRGLWLRPA